MFSNAQVTLSPEYLVLRLRLVRTLHIPGLRISKVRTMAGLARGLPIAATVRPCHEVYFSIVILFGSSKVWGI